MDIIVIGAGIAGVATAYSLHTAGHRVCVIERHTTVAQKASFGHGGVILPTPFDTWFGPELSFNSWPAWLGRESTRVRLSKSLRGCSWTRRFFKQPSSEQCLTRYARLKPLIDLSSLALAEIETRHAFEFEQRTGILHLFRHASELKRIAPALLFLKQHEYPYQLLDAEECYRAEPSIPMQPPLAGGILLPDDRSANCPLFAKQLKQVLEEAGVRFLLGRTVARIDPTLARVELEPQQQHFDGALNGLANPTLESMTADAIVLTAGAGSLPLLAQAGVRLPLQLMQLHTIIAPIAYEERAPHLTLIDTVRHITMARFNNRLRVAGGMVGPRLKQTQFSLDHKLRQQTLNKVAHAVHDWLPGVTKLSTGSYWDGQKLLSPDGLPIVGATAHPRLWVNLAHGPVGWALACGAAQALADQLTGQACELDADTLLALSPTRF
ncbi:MAG: D-amino-acid dehydrogenase [Glomeribacter sp. 1016415]|nr:D-amino-acid dehydrogenase [Glomeribacter sp. 1016415]